MATSDAILSDSAVEELMREIAKMDPEQATLAMVQIIFARVAEIDGLLGALVPVIGAMAGRLGLNREDIEKLTKMGVDK